jgi:hypothetical protein
MSWMREQERGRERHHFRMPFSYTLLLLPLLVLFAGVPFLLTLRNSAATESPWFWAYLFGMFALVALSFASPKFAARQAQLEQQFQGHERAAQIRHGEEANIELSTPQNTIVTLWPLYVGLSAATVIAWVVFWWTRKRPAIATAPANPAAP